MSHSLIQRSLGVFMAAMFTLVILGSIDHLAQPGEQPSQMAHKTTQTLSQQA